MTVAPNGSRTMGEQRVVRVIVTADNHLSAYTPRLSPAKLARRRERLGKAFKQTVDAALERHVHLFIQAGDLFDGVDPRNKEREFVAAQLMRLRSAGITIFAVSGNHDTPRQKIEQGGIAPQSIYHHLGGLHYFDSSDTLEPVVVEVAGLRVAIAGLSYHPGIAPGGDPLDHVAPPDPGGTLENADLGILILHAAIEGHAFPGDQEILVRRSSLARFDGFHVIVSGHVHAYDRFSIGEKAVVVCGATERMDFGQSEDKTGFAYLELVPAGLRHAEHIPIKPQLRHTVRIRTTELWPPQPNTESSALSSLQGLPTDRILQQLAPLCSEEAMVRLLLEGPITSDQYHQLDVRSIWMYAQQRTFSFELDESNLLLKNDQFQDDIERGERVAPRDMLESIVREFMEQAETPGERTLLTKTRQRVLDRYDELAGREVSQ